MSVCFGLVMGKCETHKIEIKTVNQGLFLHFIFQDILVV